MSFVTFIVPTIGRPTLERTLKSLVDQEDGDWNAVVVADAVENFQMPRLDNRICSLNLDRKLGESNHGGYVRNQGIHHAEGLWIGFVDDDDRLDREYSYWLKAESYGCDLLVFRMKNPDGMILPEKESLDCCRVGISFALRTGFQREKGLMFGNSGLEDWAFIEHAREVGARIKISKRIAYYVRH